MLVEGRGKRGLSPPRGTLDAGNSGTTIRLLSGVLAGQPFRSVITGDESLRARPMERVIRPLTLMGARVESLEGNGRAPLAIEGGKLQAIRYSLPVPSAQVKSAILLAALYAEGETVLRQPAVSRDHTERMLRTMGAPLEQQGLEIRITPPSSGELEPLDMIIPGDISSAAFWMVAGAIHPQAEIVIRGVGLNPTRDGVIEVLQSMGAALIIENQRSEGEEPVGDIVVRSSPLHGTVISGDLIPRLIDEIPVLAVAAAVAWGETVIRDARELRVKESDRIAATVAELTKLGARIEELPDGMVIEGVETLRGGRCRSHGDHRLAMALAVAGLVARGETVISGAEAVSISYPAFWDDLERLSG